MAGPGDEIAAGAGGRSHLRASHADREQVIGTLKAAFVQGMLAKDEFDQRVGQTLAARTYGELAAVTADLTPGLITAPPPRLPARARTRPPLSKVVAGAALIIPAPAMVAAAVITGSDVPGNSDVLGNVAVLTVLVYFMAWIAAGLQLIANWQDKRSGRQSPPRPAPGLSRQASRRLPSAGPGGQLPPAGPGQQQSADAAPIRRPRCPAGGHKPPRDISRIRHSAALHQPSPAANPSL
jgi:hypothetical protein